MPTTNGLSHMVPMEGEYFILENIFFSVHFKSLKGIIFVSGNSASGSITLQKSHSIISYLKCFNSFTWPSR